MPKKITISLPDYLVKDLKEIARVHGITQSSVIATALYKEYKELQGNHKPIQSHKVAYKKVAPNQVARKG
jgi:metal-responsive CopG/Arc/MetJ family transcriptional regulator